MPSITEMHPAELSLILKLNVFRSHLEATEVFFLAGSQAGSSAYLSTGAHIFSVGPAGSNLTTGDGVQVFEQASNVRVHPVPEIVEGAIVPDGTDPLQGALNLIVHLAYSTGADTLFVAACGCGDSALAVEVFLFDREAEEIRTATIDRSLIADLRAQVLKDLDMLIQVPSFEKMASRGDIVRCDPREPKIGRNEPCPCDSGDKYKRCCGA